MMQVFREERKDLYLLIYLIEMSTKSPLFSAAPLGLVSQGFVIFLPLQNAPYKLQGNYG